MRLLLTRSAEDSARTRTKLETAGHRVTVSPVIEISATGAGWPDGVVDAVIATSGQVFSVVARGRGPSPETRRIIPLHLVGDRTAAQAREHGFLGTRTVASNVASLALALGRMPVWPRRVVYLAGRERKPDLETALDVIGRDPEVIEIYDARETTGLTEDGRAMLREHPSAGVLHFSRRSAQLFRRQCAAVGQDIRSLTHFCLSNDAAGPLREAGCVNIEVAEAPNEPALLTLLDAN